MQVTCPNCGEKVPADHINIQKMTAVCPACDTVFAFDVPETQKAKRRKVKQPVNLMLNDDATLHMAFWTNFRLDKNEAFISSALGGIGFTLIALLLLGEHNAPPILTVTFLLIGLSLFYRLALTVINKTHIEMDDDAIKVTRQPLPNPLNQGHDVSLAGITAIKYDETAASKKDAYDTPRYQVWAQTTDGSRRTIINDVTEAYAVFIAQRLEERLMDTLDADPDVSHLEDDQTDQQPDIQHIIDPSQNHSRR